jgi:hypothetical protein
MPAANGTRAGISVEETENSGTSRTRGSGSWPDDFTDEQKKHPVGGRPVDKGWPPLKQGNGAWYDYMSFPYYLMEGYYSGLSDLPTFTFPFRPDQLDNYPTMTVSNSSSYCYESELFSEYCDGVYQYRSGISSFLKGLPESPTLYKLYHGVDVGDPLECAFAIPLKLTGHAEVRFLLDGVSCEVKCVDLGVPSLMVVASGEGLRTDVSGLKVVEDQRYQERIAVIKTMALRFWEQVRQRRDRYWLLHHFPGIGRKESQTLSSPGYAQDFRNGIKKRLA